MPENRTPDFENPLEKIEQLLTCAICLDRYRTPKLLPCQHTFCLDPCLENLVDHVRRSIKCPECRAEHPVPYDGVKVFQTNFTMTGFLEVHLQATEDNSAEMEAYIRRYNMERCKVCDEKADVEYCPHCEKRICAECRATHTEMVKRDLSRLMNQVKRLSARIAEASDSLSRGLDSLQTNCEVVKAEMRDYVQRFIKDLKKREELLTQEIDQFCAAETTYMRAVRDNLELETSNISEACARVDACIKGESEISVHDVTKYKQMFADGLETLRTFNPDTEDFSTKRIRFAVGPDPHLLPHAITQFGELQLLSSHMTSSKLHTNTTTAVVPRFLNLMLESDNYPLKRRSWDPTNEVNVSSWTTSQQAPSSRNDQSGSSEFSRTNRHYGSERTTLRRTTVEIDPSKYAGGSSRLRAPPHVVAEASESRRSSASPRNTAADEPSTANSSASRNYAAWMNEPSNSPWSRVQHMQVEPAPIAVPTVVRHEPLPPSPPVRHEPQPAPRNVAPVHPVDPPANASHQPVPPIAPRVPRQLLPSESEVALDVMIDSIRRGHEAARQQREQDQVSPAPDRAEPPAERPPTMSNQRRSSLRVRTSVELSVQEERSVDEEADQENAEEEEESGEEYPIPIMHYPPSPQPSPNVNLPLHVVTSESPPTVSTTGREGQATPPIKNPINWKKYLIPSPTHETAPEGATSSSSSFASAARHHFSADNRSGSNDSGTEDATWNERRRAFIRSKTNPEFLSTGELDQVVKRQAEVAAARKPAQAESGSQSTAAERRQHYRRSDSSSELSTEQAPPTNSTEERRNRYRRKAAERSHAAHVEAASKTADSTDGAHAPAAKEPRCEITVGGTYRVFTQPKVDYLDKSRMLLKFGAKGAGVGQFNWPRGIAIVPALNEIAVCDSSNHRVQIFDRRGTLIRSFGSYGSGKGEFDCLAGICVNKYRQYVVTDRYNHRVQIFDSNGRFLREFGSHGQSNGRFNSPWGVVVDNQGFIYVCDKDNHRVQIFQADGNFVGKFGGIGNHDGQFQNPHFIASNARSNQIIVSDSSNHRIQVFDHNGHFLFAFGTEGFQEGQFKYPRGVAVDEQGFIIVADSGNNRVQVFYPDGRFYATFGSWGIGDGQLKGVEGVALLEDGQIAVTDRENHRVQIF